MRLLMFLISKKMHILQGWVTRQTQIKSRTFLQGWITIHSQLLGKLTDIQGWITVQTQRRLCTSQQEENDVWPKASRDANTKNTHTISKWNIYTNYLTNSTGEQQLFDTIQPKATIQYATTTTMRKNSRTKRQ